MNGRKPDETYAKEILVLMGLTPSQTNVDQVKVFWEAMNIFEQRNNLYEDGWRTYGWRDSIHHMRSKLGRLLKMFGDDMPEKNLDDAHDLLNYTAFFVRNVRSGNESGED